MEWASVAEYSPRGREAGTAYRDSPKSKCWVCPDVHCELDKFVDLSFHTEQLGQLKHYSHDFESGHCGPLSIVVSI